jgi:hypothetical protein
LSEEIVGPIGPVGHDPGGKVRIAVERSVVSDALFSECGRYRYWLERRWDGLPIGSGGHVLWVMMNPSVADIKVDDPTVKKCRKHTTLWGHGAMIVCNAFAYRATNPKMLLQAEDPVGPLNDETIARCVRGASRVLVAWGKPPTQLGNRGLEVSKILKAAGAVTECLVKNNDGSPAHPLYQKLTTIPEVWSN